ncbi:MAG: hypothetical protein HY596_05030 [Candidatus Omnitrophica bacterium]|nr:hypothetical protein [Candidatus Omnitrophota bacterium]
MDHARKSQLEKRIFAGLLVVFGVGLVSMLKSFWHAPAGPAVVQTPPRLQEAETSAASQERALHAQLAKISKAGDQPPIRYTASDFRDPLVSLLPKPEAASPAAGGAAQTRPAETPVAPAVSVEGMFWGGPRPQVLIDGQLYDIGDTVGGSRIAAITREGVTVVKQGETFVLQPPAVMMEHGR